MNRIITSKAGNILRLTIAALSMLVTIHQVTAQQYQGIVTDTTGQPVSGAVLWVKRAPVIQTTDEQGMFALDAKAGDTLLLFAGYTPSEWVLGTNNQLNIELMPENGNARVSYSTGYGNQLMRHMSGPVTYLDEQQFNQGHIYHPYQLIRSRAPGLTVAKPGSNPLGSFDIHQRGLHTLLGNNEPLVVIDGFAGASLMTIDPADIASITLLRSASMAAVYGARGANGVILITTKKAQGRGPKLSYRVYGAYDQVAAFPDVLSAEDYARAVADPNLIANKSFDLGQRNNFPRQVTRNAFSQAHQLTLSQHKENSGYRFSFNYRHTEGIAQNVRFNQWNALLNAQQKVFDDKLRLNAQLSYTQRPYRDVLGDLFWYAATFNPTAPVFSDNPQQYGGYFQQNLFDFYNPVALLNQVRKEGDIGIGTINTSAQLDIAKGLTLNGRLGFQQNNHVANGYISNQSFYPGIYTNGHSLRSQNNLTNLLGEAFLSYDLGFKKHQLQLSGGYSYQQITRKNLEINAYDFVSDPVAIDNPGATWGSGAFPPDIAGYKSQILLAAFFGQLNYNWNEALFVSGSLRREGSTRFGADNKWGMFYGVNAGLELKRFLPEADFISQLRLRAGWGYAGNLPPEGALSVGTFIPSTPFYYNGRFVNSYIPFLASNPALQWEGRHELNAGIDIGLADNRWGISADYYNNASNDLIYRYFPVANDFRQVYRNLGAIRNKGVELTLRAQPLSEGELRWNISANLTISSSVYGSFDPLLSDNESLSIIANLGGLPGLKTSGNVPVGNGIAVGQFRAPVFSSVSEIGTWIFEDINGDGGFCGCENDFADVGTGLPKATWGIGNNLNYGAWELSFFIRGVSGHSILNAQRLVNGVPFSGRSYNLHNQSLESPYSQVNFPGVLSDLFVENASFVQLDNVNLKYTFALKGNKKLAVFIAANQLLTLSAYSGFDPEPRLFNRLEGGFYNDYYDVMAPGFDTKGTHYSTRTWVIGLEASLF